MNPKFEVVFLKEAIHFMSRLDLKTRKKIYFNLDRARFENNPKLFKKLTHHIWEFRVLYKRTQYRMFAFWDKTDTTNTLVIVSHGMVKKVGAVPKTEIQKALVSRAVYFEP